MSCWKHLNKREQEYWVSTTLISSNCHAGSISTNESKNIGFQQPLFPPIVMLEASQQTRARVLGFNNHNFLQLSFWKHLSKREQQYWVSTTLISSNCHAGSISTNKSEGIGTLPA
ncbi:hypothetical protein RCH18_000545 [Flavobacterium sp. PL11]|uniref:hypothetical protein n=1 Tax=Flavobacterium sp. PL11 TaxID=3071717 RepID=UPI002E039146|nr:hypothetical protein [Flavobacterium sp. PL11]